MVTLDSINIERLPGPVRRTSTGVLKVCGPLTANSLDLANGLWPSSGSDISILWKCTHVFRQLKLFPAILHTNFLFSFPDVPLKRLLKIIQIYTRAYFLFL